MWCCPLYCAVNSGFDKYFPTYKKVGTVLNDHQRLYEYNKIQNRQNARNKMNALVLIDLQNDYFPGGTMELVGSESAGENAAKLLSRFRQKGLPIWHVQHISTRPGSTFFLPNTSGVNFHASVSPLVGERVITKNYPNAFRKTTLLQQLRVLKIESLIIAGMMTHMCVDTTVRAAYDLGFSCTVAHDACATRNLIFGNEPVFAQHVQAAYMASLNGIFADIEDTETLCRRL